MIRSFNAANADVLWRDLVSAWQAEARHQHGRDQPTRELLHVAFSLSNPRQRLIRSRPINTAFAIAEVFWILGGRKDVGFLAPWNSKIRQYSDDGKGFHGAYGHRLRTQYGFDQLQAAAEALEADPRGRQVVLQIWNPRVDFPGHTPRSKDIPCNIASHLMIRKGRLEWLQVVRSNDLYLGVPYNLIQFTTLQEIMAGWLNIQPGSFNQVSDSLHVYRRHWSELQQLEAPPLSKISRLDLRVGRDKWAGLQEDLVTATNQLGKAVTSNRVWSIWDQLDVPRPYSRLLAVLVAERLRRLKDADGAQVACKAMDPYYRDSWQRWRDGIRTRSKSS